MVPSVSVIVPYRHQDGGRNTYNVKDIRELLNRRNLVADSLLSVNVLLEVLPSRKCGKNLCAIDVLQSPSVGTSDEAIRRVGPHMGHETLPGGIEGSLVHIGGEKDVCDLNDGRGNERLNWLVQDDGGVEWLEVWEGSLDNGLDQVGDGGVDGRRLGGLVGLFR